MHEIAKNTNIRLTTSYYKSELQLLLNRFGKTFETIHDAIIRDTEIAIFLFV